MNICASGVWKSDAGGMRPEGVRGGKWRMVSSESESVGMSVEEVGERNEARIMRQVGDGLSV